MSGAWGYQQVSVFSLVGVRNPERSRGICLESVILRVDIVNFVNFSSGYFAEQQVCALFGPWLTEMINREAANRCSDCNGGPGAASGISSGYPERIPELAPGYPGIGFGISRDLSGISSRKSFRFRDWFFLTSLIFLSRPFLVIDRLRTEC